MEHQPQGRGVLMGRSLSAGPESASADSCRSQLMNRPVNGRFSHFQSQKRGDGGRGV